MKTRLRLPPAPPAFLPTSYNAQLLLDFVGFVVRCQQGSGSGAMNYITPAVLDRIRRNRTGSERLVLAHTNRALRMLKAKYPAGHEIWRYIEHPNNPQSRCLLLL